MKRILIASILGIIASVSFVQPSYGIGQVWFDNYGNANPNSPYGDGYSSPIYLIGNTFLPTTFKVDFYYTLGTFSEPSSSGMPTGTLLSTRQIAFPGYVAATVVTIPDYVSGPVTFELAAYDGSSYATSLVRGHSASLTLSSVAVPPQIPSSLDGLQSFTLIPEPSVFALSVVGLGTLIAARRRGNFQVWKSKTDQQLNGKV
jgi:hypothetical protein